MILSAHLGRFLTYGGRLSEADEFIAEADRIRRRLDLQSVLLSSKAARGRWLADSGDSDEHAVRVLREVAQSIYSLDDEPLFTKFDVKAQSTSQVIKGRHPSLCRVLLDLNRAALFAGDEREIDQTLDELDELATEVFPGYRPHYYLSQAQCLLTAGDPRQKDFAQDLIRRARELGEEISASPRKKVPGNALNSRMPTYGFSTVPDSVGSKASQETAAAMQSAGWLRHAPHQCSGRPAKNMDSRSR